MKQQDKKSVIYYTDLTEDFAGTNIKTKALDAKFPYIHDDLPFRVGASLLYYIIALPLVWFYIRVINGTKFVNKKALRAIKGGFYLYGNHTHWSDSFLPHVIAAPKRTYVVANPDAVSIRGIKTIVQMVGAIPVPDTVACLRKFVDALEIRGKQGACVAIYPEAHIWPYYTGIRPFPDSAFKYPAKFHLPVVAMVTTFRKRKGLLGFIKTPARTVVLSNPIYAKEGMTMHESQVYFHEQVYEFMQTYAERPDNYEYVQYIQKQQDEHYSAPSAEDEADCAYERAV